MSGGVWIASYVVLWIAVLALGITVVALLRQIGVLHTRVAPMGVHFAGEGPEKDQPAPDTSQFDYSTNSVTLVAFTAPTCELCAKLHPGLVRMEQSYAELGLRTLSSETDASTFSRFRVRSTPYLVAIDRGGVVRSRGVANTLDQAEEMLAEVLASTDQNSSNQHSSNKSPGSSAS
ncbi:MAG: thiol-disulfide isomerase/thioredoxin [Acidimicrobiales bacterium]|jgi:thiol-disulfide isomerase/thioredoxin